MNFLIDWLLTLAVIWICSWIFSKFKDPKKEEKFSSGAIWIAAIIMSAMGISLIMNQYSYGIIEDQGLRVVSILIGISFLLVSSIGLIRIFRHKLYMKQNGLQNPPVKMTAFGMIISFIVLAIIVFIIVEIIWGYSLPHP